MNGKQCQQFMASQETGVINFDTLRSCGFRPNILFRAQCDGISAFSESALAVRSLLASIEVLPETELCATRSSRRLVAFGVRRRLPHNLEIWQVWIDCSELHADYMRKNATSLWKAIVGERLEIYSIENYYELVADIESADWDRLAKDRTVDELLHYFCEVKLGFSEVGLKVSHFFYPTPSFESHKRQTEAPALPVPDITRESMGIQLSR